MLDLYPLEESIPVLQLVSASMVCSHEGPAPYIDSEPSRSDESALSDPPTNGTPSTRDAPFSGPEHVQPDGNSPPVLVPDTSAPDSNTQAQNTEPCGNDQAHNAQAGDAAVNSSREQALLKHSQQLLIMMAAIVSIGFFAPFVVKTKPEPFSVMDEHTGYLESPSTRGTSTVVWSCVSTILTSSYALLYFDVPDKEKDPNESRSKRIFGSIKSFLDVLFGVFFKALAPDLETYSIISKSLRARKLRTRMREHLKLSERQWTLRHQFFADMGGFWAYVPATTEAGAEASPNHVILIIDEASVESLKESDFKKEPLSDFDLDIKDKGGGGFKKAVATIQASGIIARCIIRSVNGQPISPLEVTTCSYLACAFFSLILLWDKPHGVGRRISISDKCIQHQKGTEGRAEDSASLARCFSILAEQNRAYTISVCNKV